MENPGKTFFEKLKWEFIFFLARRLPDCRTITPMFSQSLDRELTLREKIVMKLHLFTCDACKKYVHQIKFMHEAFQEQEKMFAELESPAAPKLNLDARERMKAALRAANNQN